MIVNTLADLINYHADFSSFPNPHKLLTSSYVSRRGGVNTSNKSLNIPIQSVTYAIIKVFHTELNLGVTLYYMLNHVEVITHKTIYDDEINISEALTDLYTLSKAKESKWIDGLALIKSKVGNCITKQRYQSVGKWTDMFNHILFSEGKYTGVILSTIGKYEDKAIYVEATTKKKQPIFKSSIRQWFNLDSNLNYHLDDPHIYTGNYFEQESVKLK